MYLQYFDRNTHFFIVVFLQYLLRKNRGSIFVNYTLESYVYQLYHFSM